MLLHSARVHYKYTSTVLITIAVIGIFVNSGLPTIYSVYLVTQRRRNEVFTCMYSSKHLNIYIRAQYTRLYKPD